MKTAYLVNFLGEAVLGWMAAVSLLVVGYLIVLEFREIRRNRRFDAERQRLGLRRTYRPVGSWLL